MLTTLDNRLNDLMHVMMNMLSSDYGNICMRLMRRRDNRLIFELLRSLCNLGLNVPLVSFFVLEVALVVTMMELALFHTHYFVCMLLRKHLPVGNGLHRRVIVILVYLTVDGCRDVLVQFRLNGFVCHGGCNSLADRCVVVTGFGHEVRNGLAGFVHDEFVLECFGVRV